MASLITFLPETPNMDRLRSLTTQAKRRPTQSTDDHSGPIEHQDIPAILPTILDGAVENINSSDYAKRCREIIDLDKALRDLGYIFSDCV